MNQEQSFLEYLPLELFETIAQYLTCDPRTLLSLRRTNKGVYDMCERIKFKIYLTSNYYQYLTLMKYIEYCKSRNPVQRYVEDFLEWSERPFSKLVLKGRIFRRPTDDPRNSISTSDNEKQKISRYVSLVHSNYHSIVMPIYVKGIIETQKDDWHLCTTIEATNQASDFIDFEMLPFSRGLPKFSKLFLIHFFAHENVGIPHKESTYFRLGLRASFIMDIRNLPQVAPEPGGFAPPTKLQAIGLCKFLLIAWVVYICIW